MKDSKGRYDEDAAALLAKYSGKGARITLVIVLGPEPGFSVAAPDDIYIEARASLPEILEDVAKKIRTENSGDSGAIRTALQKGTN